MVTTKISLYVLLGLFLMDDVGSTCVPVECLSCNISLAESCDVCHNDSHCMSGKTDIPPNCKKAFAVFVNSTGSSAQEGDDITLTCVHDLPNLDLAFSWTKDGSVIVGQNTSELVLEGVLSPEAGQYSCSVLSGCGSYTSLPHEVTVANNSVIILVICGVSALVLVLIMALVMKFKLKRDNTKHKERMRQRAQIGQSGGPAPFTPRGS
ncbi:uncharacterized protein [Embiotoca jacksoni]|uniref:uncharacterized protein n=1 Tax=Embiotoca jacksoni TaxID=100190 RepID=UPI0037041C48